MAKLNSWNIISICAPGEKKNLFFFPKELLRLILSLGWAQLPAHFPGSLQSSVLGWKLCPGMGSASWDGICVGLRAFSLEMGGAYQFIRLVCLSSGAELEGSQSSTRWCPLDDPSLQNEEGR